MVYKNQVKKLGTKTHQERDGTVLCGVLVRVGNMTA
jgi:hypothetical protein